jgi:PIN like domain
LKFLFDNNLPPSLARGIGELSKFDPVVEQVIPLKDKFAPNTPDLEWLGALAAEGGWIVVSIDRFKKSTAEREMLRRQGLTVFVLDPQWSKPYWGQAAQLVLWWPKIVDVAKLTSKTALRVPWRYTSKSTFEQIRV